MRATIPFPCHRFYAAAAQLGLLPGYRHLLDDFPHAPPVLDVGCGPGDVAYRLSQAQDVVGIDIDPRMVRLARKRHGEHAACRFQTADVAGLPFEDGSFGAAWASETFHHWHDQDAGLRELHRVLKKRSELWIVEARADMSRQEFRQGFGMPAFPGLYGGLRRAFRTHGVRDIDAPRVVAQMEAAGFKAEARHEGAWMVFVGRR